MSNAQHSPMEMAPSEQTPSSPHRSDSSSLERTYELSVYAGPDPLTLVRTILDASCDIHTSLSSLQRFVLVLEDRKIITSIVKYL